MKTNAVRLEAGRPETQHQARSAQTVNLERLEGLAVLAASALLYAQNGSSLWLFLALLLAPDIAMLGYLRGPKTGALAYNLAHTMAFPVALALTGTLAGSSTLTALGLIWLAHIGMDRALGYGLKLETGFQDTTLGRIGRAAA